MDLTLPYDIRNLRINDREKNNRSRRRLGFHVFLSRYYIDFKEFPLEQQWGLIYFELGKRVGNFRITINDDDTSIESIDSTNSVLKEKVCHHDIHRAACRHWNLLPINIKRAWCSRAMVLNRRKLPGRFVGIPWRIGRTQPIESLEKNVLDALSYEWDEVVVFFRRIITREPKVLLSSMSYKFGNERVLIGSQTYREFRISYLVELSIFGKEYCNIKKNEIIFKSKKQILFHISSQKRMKEIFSKEELDATEYEVTKNNYNYTQTCSGKVNLKYNNRNVVGYILEESRGKWKILLASNKIILKNPLIYCHDRKKYLFPTRGKYIITEYWPIRLLMKINGRGLRITLNRIAFKKKSTTNTN